MDDRRRVAGMILVLACAVLLPIAGAIGRAWLAAPLLVLGGVGLSLLAAVMIAPRPRGARASAADEPRPAPGSPPEHTSGRLPRPGPATRHRRRP